MYNINDNWVVKGGVSTGYRTPELREMADGWVQESRGGDVYGNPDLSPETTLNKELAVYYSGDAGLEYSITVFQNDFDDKIAIASCELSVCLDETDRYNINVDEAESYGAEFAAKYYIGNWSFNGAYSFTRSEQKTGANEGKRKRVNAQSSCLIASGCYLYVMQCLLNLLAPSKPTAIRKSANVEGALTSVEEEVVAKELASMISPLTMGLLVRLITGPLSGVPVGKSAS